MCRMLWYCLRSTGLVRLASALPALLVLIFRRRNRTILKDWQHREVDTTRLIKTICSFGEFNPMNQSKKSEESPQASSSLKSSRRYSTNPRVQRGFRLLVNWKKRQNQQNQAPSNTSPESRNPEPNDAENS